MKKTKLFIALSTLFLIACAIQDNSKLSELAMKDQSDRKQNNPETFKNDIARIAEVRTILENDVLKTSNDFFNAAIVLQHSDKPEDYKMANKLAIKAVELDPGNKDAKVLIAQSMDRYLLSINKPQIYGTQRITLGELDYLLAMDTLTISDKQRQTLGISTLKEQLEYFNRRHKKEENNLFAYVPSDSLYRVYYPEKRADLIGTFEELLSNIEYPEAALKNNISGKVLVEYMITPEGNTKDIMVVEGIGYGCDEEAARIISMAKFKNYLNREVHRRTRIPFEIKK